MKSEAQNHQGFVSLTWSDPKNESSEIRERRAQLQSSLRKEPRAQWGGDCCDDGCESS